jgi:hypothetical protein
MQQPNGISSGLSVMTPRSDLLSPDQSIEQMVDRALSTNFPSSVGQSPSNIRPLSTDLSGSSMTRPSPFGDVDPILPTIFDDSFSASFLPFPTRNNQARAVIPSSKPSTEGHSPLHPSLALAKHMPARVPLGDVTGSHVNNCHNNPVNGSVEKSLDQPLKKPINTPLDQPPESPANKHRPPLSYIELPPAKPKKAKKAKGFYYAASRIFSEEVDLNLRERVEKARSMPEYQNKGDAAIRAKLLHDEWDALDEETRQSYRERAKKEAEAPIPTKYCLYNSIVLTDLLDQGN